MATLTVDGGKGAVTYAGAANKTYAYAKIKTTAGIFAESAIELTSEVVESAPVAATKVELKEASTPADATVEFTGLHKAADGKVYIIQSDNVNTTAAAMVANIGKDNAIASAEVTGGSTSVSIANVFKGKWINSATSEDLFVALFVPDDTSIYSQVYSDVFTLQSVPTSLEFVAAIGTGTGTAPADGDPDDADDDITFTTDNSEIAVKNQFGAKITVSGKTVSNKAVDSISAKNAGGNYGEAFGNATYSISAAGALSVKIERNTKIDKGDGLEFTILGSKFTMTAPFGVGGHNETKCYTLKLGEDTLYTASLPAAGLEVKDEASLHDALAGAGAGDVVIYDGAATALNKAITVKADTTLKIKAGATLTLGANGNKIYGTVDAGTGTGIFAAAGKTITAYDGAEIIGQKTAARMTGLTALKIDSEATTNGVKVTDNDGTNAGQSVTFTYGTASAGVGATDVATATVTVDSTNTITIAADGNALQYTVA